MARKHAWRAFCGFCMIFWPANPAFSCNSRVNLRALDQDRSTPGQNKIELGILQNIAHGNTPNFFSVVNLERKKLLRGKWIIYIIIKNKSKILKNIVLDLKNLPMSSWGCICQSDSFPSFISRYFLFLRFQMTNYAGPNLIGIYFEMITFPRNWPKYEGSNSCLIILEFLNELSGGKKGSHRLKEREWLRDYIKVQSQEIKAKLVYFSNEISAKLWTSLGVVRIRFPGFLRFILPQHCKKERVSRWSASFYKTRGKIEILHGKRFDEISFWSISFFPRLWEPNGPVPFLGGEVCVIWSNFRLRFHSGRISSASIGGEIKRGLVCSLSAKF